MGARAAQASSHDVPRHAGTSVLCALEAAGDLAQAISSAQRWAAADPLSEHAHVTAMHLYARLGRHTNALRQYDRLVQLLDRELKIGPLPETRALAATLRSEIELARHVPARVTPLPFVGRAAERALMLEAVEAMIAGRSGVIAVEGEAGIGKSRLLDEIAASARWRGVTVVMGRATEYPSVSPLTPLVEALTPVLSAARDHDRRCALGYGFGVGSIG